MNHNEKILSSLIKNKPSPILLEESSACFTIDFIYEFMKSICCTKSETFCNTCEICWKISRRKYFDCHLINTYKDSVHKEDISNIINQFYYSSLERYGNKFLIIYGIENVNKQIANMLLKNIENPTKNTYYIFVTRNQHNIVNTIKSRCVYYKINNEENRFKKELIKNNVDQKYFNFFLSHFYSMDEVLEFYNNENFEKIVSVCETLTTSKDKLTSIHKSLMKFKTFSYYEIAKLLFLLEPNISVDNKQKIYYLISSLKFNLNKTLVFNEILSIIK